MKTAKPTTKQRILGAALELLETGGIRGLTQPAVASLLGISQGQLTYHFQKRSDLIFAVTQATLDRVAEYLWEKAPDLASRSFDQLLALMVSLMKSESQVRALLGLIVEADDNPAVREQLTVQGHKVRTLIATALKLEETAPEVTISHAVMLGFSILLFLRRDPREQAKLVSDFKMSAEILKAHLKSRKKVKRHGYSS